MNEDENRLKAAFANDFNFNRFKYFSVFGMKRRAQVQACLLIRQRHHAEGERNSTRNRFSSVSNRFFSTRGLDGWNLEKNQRELN
jgi:hypothetical protein